jgi:hypothetical protein
MFGGNAEDVAHEPVVQAGLIDHWREEFGLNPPVVIYLVATGIKLTEVQKNCHETIPCFTVYVWFLYRLHSSIRTIQ